MDLGGGTGSLADRLVGTFEECVVLEPDRRKASYGIRSRRASFIRGVAESAPFREGSFDTISAIVSFHHVQDQERALTETGRLLRAGGLLVMIEVDVATSRGRLLRFLETKILGHHIRFLTQAELSEMMARHSFRLLPGGSTRRGFMLVAEKS